MINLSILRKFFLKCFVIGFIFLLFITLIFIPFKDNFASFASNLLGIAPDDYIQMGYYFLTIMKKDIFVFFLIPFLALTCLEKCKCNKEES